MSRRALAALLLPWLDKMYFKVSGDLSDIMAGC